MLVRDQKKMRDKEDLYQVLNPNSPSQSLLFIYLYKREQSFL